MLRLLTYPVLVGALYWPAVYKIRKERSNTLHQFLSIPKGAINSILNTLSGENEVKEIEDDAFEESHNEASVVLNYTRSNTSILKQLTIRYHISLCMSA
jgi:hypothetical protein